MAIVERSPYNRPYHPKHQDTLEFFAWFNTFFNEENKVAPMHFQMIDHINGKSNRKCLECTRGASKSTLVGVYYLLYCVFKGKKFNHGEINFVIYIMDSVQQVASQIDRLIYTIEENKELNKYLKITKSKLGDDPTIYIYNKLIDREIYIKGRGTGQKIRGVNVRHYRPDWIIMDDIENDESVINKENREKLKNWFQAAVVPAVNPNNYEFTFIGTPLHADSLLLNLIESDDWSTIQLPIAEQYPPEAGMAVVSCWEDRFTKEYIKSSYESYKGLGKAALWYQEHMLIITPSESLLYNMDNIKRYNSAEMVKNLQGLTYYISVDLAISERDTADYTAIAVIGVNENNHWFLVDGTYGRFKPDDTIDKIFMYVAKYRPYSVVLEKVAFQMAMKTFIYNEQVKRGMFFGVDMINRPNNKNGKLTVLKSFQPIVEMGRFWIPADIMENFTEELVTEMSTITVDKILAKHDDLIDAIAQLTLIDIIASTSIKDEPGLDIMDGEQTNSYLF